jgi:hypothetical protein
MRGFLHDHAELVMAVVLIVGFAIAIGGALFSDHRQQDACTRGGGTVVRYNVQVIIDVPCGSGCTAFVPTEVGDWRGAHKTAGEVY